MSKVERLPVADVDVRGRLARGLGVCPKWQHGFHPPAFWCYKDRGIQRNVTILRWKVFKAQSHPAS